jgi:hypothetical protein|tara:strand:- start:234 stop:1121 length:888 start_codon:yes stop_codon:yes gene_type:complete
MRKSVGKPKQKFIAYAKVYKLVDGKYVPEHDSTTLLHRTHTSEGIGLNEFKSSCKGVDLANAMEQLVLKKKYIRELKKLEQGKDLIKVPSSHFPLDVSYLNDLEKKEYEKELKSEIERISDTTINGLEAVAHKVSFNDKSEQILTVFNVKQEPNKIMKTNYIRSNSKLAKWIHKRFEKYSSNLNCKMPRYYINRRDMVEKFGSYMMEETSDCTCIGRCWTGGWNLIWIDVNYHDKRWGSKPKEFRKNLDNTIAHEMVHLKFDRRSHPLHVKHDGSKQRREFNRRVNQVVRGKKYD